MTEVDATETKEPNVPFPVAITWQNIKTELKIKKKMLKKKIRLSNDVCGLYIDKD